MSTMVFNSIQAAIEESIYYLKEMGVEVDTGHWQGVPTEGKPDLVTEELMNLSWRAPMPEFEAAAAELCRPNMPWAEDHFQERVSRDPSNPGEQYKNWPWWQEGSERTTMRQVRQRSPEDFDLAFDHTYQERFWPKDAGQVYWSETGSPTTAADYGIRYRWGDLDDVVNLLRKHPFTRQATFPIFFPEDTGAVHGGRVPCTLHYHFLRRGHHLHLWYPIRSCDAVRHFRDDIYMAVRLCQWVLRELGQDAGPESEWEMVKPGFLHFTAYSFHVHKGDMHLL